MSDIGMAPWVVRHWLEFWFSVRNTGCPGHTPEQAREHIRHYLKPARRI